VLIPREHGAYGQLVFPLATALAIGRPTLGAVALAAAGVAAFLGHESLLIVLGQRGRRAALEQGTEARRTLLLLGTIAIVAGAIAIVWLNSLARWALALPAVITLQLAIAVLSGRERTYTGEILAAAALSAISVPVAIGEGATMRAAFTVFAVFVAIFSVATTAVHAIIVRGGHPTRSRRMVSAAVTVAAIAALFLLARGGFVYSIAAWAAVPVCVLGLYLVINPPSPRQLRLVGWTLVAATATTSILLIIALR
jgi:YwiC-like protein